MAIDSVHRLYGDMAPTWARLRDFLAGESAVKGRGEVYLPKLEEQSPDEYEAYKTRAEFMNATARTHIGLFGLIFLKDPVWAIPKQLEDMVGDANLAGQGLYGYAQQVVSEVLGMARGGTLIDWSEEEDRPYFAFYETEAIVNWRASRIGGHQRLSLLVLKEMIRDPASGEFDDDKIVQYRVFRLGPEGLDVTVFQADDKGQWEEIERNIPSRGGKPLLEIPFVFHSTGESNVLAPDRPPLDDLASINLTHYRLSADHYHGLHFVALPTPWVSGFETTQKLRIGSGAAWVSENPAAKAGFLEFTGAGLGSIRTELDRLEKTMAVMGARLLEAQKRQAETAEAMQIRQSGETAVLTGITAAISNTMTEALKWAYWWANKGEASRHDVASDVVSVELNTDFGTGRMSSGDIQAVVSSWVQRAISRQTLFHNLKQGEIMPADRTFEEEMELIDAEAAIAPGPPMDLDKDEEDDEPEDREERDRPDDE